MARLRDIDGIKGNGRPDVFRVDWHVISPDPDNDLRDLTTPENRAHIERTKNSIELEGVKDPMTIRRGDNDEVFAVDGRVRLVSLNELEAEGRPVPEFVLAIAEKEHTTRAQRIINMIVQSTQRKNYDQFEIARGVQRLHEFSGLSPEMIAERIGWKSTATVKNHLDAANLEPEVQQMVNDDVVSKTVAIAVTREKGAEAPAVLKEAKAQVDASGTKNKKITPKVIARVTGKRPTQSREMTTLALDYTAIANEIEDAAKLAGGVGNLGPEKTKALLTKALTTLARSKGQKVEEPKPDAPLASGLPGTNETEGAPVSAVESLDQLQEHIAGLTGTNRTSIVMPGDGSNLAALTQEQHSEKHGFTSPAPILPPHSATKADVLIFKFMSASLAELAAMFASLNKEHEEATADDRQTVTQIRLIRIADEIGALHFEDDWQQAKANTEMEYA